MQIQISADQTAPVAGNERQALFAIAMELTRTAPPMRGESLDVDNSIYLAHYFCAQQKN